MANQATGERTRRQLRLKEIRTTRELTQAKMAALLGIGVTVYSRYETGAINPSVDRIARFCEILGVKFEELVNTR